LTEITETVQPANVGFTVPNGPFIVTGELQIEIAGAEPLSQPRASLCRCGASAKKPFCDGSHKTSGWAEAGDFAPAENLGDPGPSGPVVFVPIANGPLLANGPLTLQNGQKQTIANTVETALCRCGASANKPYCDGSHSTIGFQG
jgi:CDGSH-type Zn-finger protein